MEEFLEKVDRPEELSTAIEGAQAAGKVMDKYQEKQNLDFKEKTSNNDIVTEADLEAQEVIVEVIKKNFPNDGIYAEEDLNTEEFSDRKWVIDPIDGTSNFERGISYSCTSIGLKINEEYVLGVVYSPESGLNQMFFACKGSGAYKVEKGELEQLNVSNHTSIESAMILGSINERDDEGRQKDLELVENLMRTGSKFRRIGSAALNICKVAEGSADAVMYRRLYEWDFAAGKVILEEAGGSFNINKQESGKFSILGTNSKLQGSVETIFGKYKA